MVEENHNSRILAEAVGGKTARACDGCVKRRARWYCAADDAFLCQSCDVTVHSVNSLARRHDRVRLKSASFSPKPSSAAATWHQGFTRKPRTPRSGGPVKKSDRLAAIHDLVPEIGTDNDTENNSEEERLFYQVPEFDPIVSDDSNGNGNGNVDSCLNGFFPTDKELAEFAADVETLFGNGPENESFAIEELGQRSNPFPLKVEAEQSEEAVIEYNGCYNHSIVEGEQFDLSFDYDSRASFMEEDDERKVGIVKEEGGKQKDADEDDDSRKRKNNDKKDLMLNLDYESVIATWGGQGPPWMAGSRPEFDPEDQNWPACLSSVNGGAEVQYQYGAASRVQAGFTDEGREARVSRYREKRRTRLFSKKIRYEVRKLNAEKRPRLKGRFVKRSAFTLLSSK